MGAKAVKAQASIVSAGRTVQVSYLCCQSFVGCFLGRGFGRSVFSCVVGRLCVLQSPLPCHSNPFSFPRSLTWLIFELIYSAVAVLSTAPIPLTRRTYIWACQVAIFFSICFPLVTNKLYLSGFKMNFCASLKSLLSKLWERECMCLICMSICS